MRREMRDAALDAMLEERDNLKIQINLMENPDGGSVAGGTLSKARRELAALEQRISDLRKAAER